MSDQLVSISFTGAARLAATMRAASRVLDDMRPPNREAAKLVSARSKVRVRVRKGVLRRSLRASASKKRGRVASTLIYAPVQEFGWPGHNISPGHFLYGALGDTENQVIRVYRDHLARSIRNVKGA